MNDDAPRSGASPDALGFLAGGGGMGERMRTHEWAATPLGPAERWPQSLRTAASILLNSKYPMFIGWGPELAMLYNDAYVPVLGSLKHPGALGRSARAVWAEIWETLGPLAHRAVEEGEPTWSDDLVLMMNRYGYLEETYFTFSYSPIRDESGGVGGMFCACTETTEKVLGERRLRCLAELAAVGARARTLDEVCRGSLQVLEGFRTDLPFALFYKLGDGSSGAARLMCATEALEGAALEALQAGLERTPGLLSAVTRGESVPLEDLPALGGGHTLASAWGDEVRAGIILPILDRGPGVPPTAALVLGLTPRRTLDERFRSFLHLVASNVAAAVSSAQAYEAELRRAEALAELDRAKTAFFSNVSHEFRTPLTLMLGPVEETLADADVPQRARERLDLAHRNALRLQKLVNSLLDFSRIEAGRMQASYEPLDLAALTRDLGSTFRSTIERAGLDFEVECPALSEPVYVDREMWEKIVLNLLSNAFKFTLEGAIAVRMREERGAALLEVQDTGVGVPPEEMPRLFERFHRIESTQGRTHEGSGIGLALVHGLVRLHGGSIEARSTLGRGTVFTVRLPLGRGHLPKDRLRAPRASASTGPRVQVFVQEALRWLPDASRSGEMAGRALAEGESLRADQRFAATFGARIVLADDNADMRAYLRELLEPCYSVEAVGDGEAALEAIRRERPALLIADVMMPRLDGFGLLRALRADEALRSLPVILLSARAGEEARLEGFAAGADDYLVKPFSARELLARVGAMLELVRLRAESDEKLATVLEQLPIGVGLLDRNGRWVISSAAMRALVPEMIPSRDPLRRARWKFLDEAGQPIPPERWPGARALRGETVWPGVEALYTTDGGAEIWVRVSATPLRDASGCAEGVICAVEDIDAAKRAAERIRESETRFRALVEASSNVIYRMSPDWSEMRHLVGRDFIADTLDPSRTWLGKYIHPDDQPQVMEAIRRAICARSTFELEHRVLRVDGSIGWTFSRAIPMLDAAGEIVEWLGTASDVTERRHAEEQLRERAEELQTVLDAVPAAIWIAHDPTARNITGNRTSYALLRLTEGANASLSAADVSERPTGFRVFQGGRELSPDELPVQVAAATGTAVEGFEEEIRFDDGRSVALYGNAAPLRDPEGQVRGAVAAFVDVTQARRAEAALRASEGRLNAMLDNATVAVFLQDERQHCVYMNRAAEALTGYTLEETRGRPMHEVIHHTRPDGRAYPLAECPLDQAFPTRNRLQGEETLVHKDGSFYPVAFTASPVPDEAGAPIGTIIELRDIRDEKRAVESLARLAAERENLLEAERAARSEAENANRLKDEFLATLSHELRTPLSVIVSWGRVLLRKHAGENDELKKGLKLIVDNAMGQSQMIGDLLDMSRIASGKSTLELEPLDLSEFVAQCVTGQQPTAQEKVSSSRSARQACRSSCSPTPRGCARWWAIS